MRSTSARPASSRRLLPNPGARLLLAACLAAGLAACATMAPGTDVQRLTEQQFAPTQTVDVLDAAPAAAYVGIARLHAADPTGSATRDQLVAQLVATARGLGADALVIEKVDRSDTSHVAFDPAGGQMQGGEQTASLAITALAIHYTR